MEAFMKKPDQDRYVQPRTYQSAYYCLDGFAFDEDESLQYLEDVIGFTQDESAEYLKMLRTSDCQKIDDARTKYVRHIEKPGTVISALCGSSSGILIGYTQRMAPLESFEKSCLRCEQEAIKIYDEDIKIMGLTPDMFKV